jgi:hypothetical protein
MPVGDSLVQTDTYTRLPLPGRSLIRRFDRSVLDLAGTISRPSALEQGIGFSLMRATVCLADHSNARCTRRGREGFPWNQICSLNSAVDLVRRAEAVID